MSKHDDALRAELAARGIQRRVSSSIPDLVREIARRIDDDEPAEIVVTDLPVPTARAILEGFLGFKFLNPYSVEVGHDDECVSAHPDGAFADCECDTVALFFRPLPQGVEA